MFFEFRICGFHKTMNTFELANTLINKHGKGSDLTRTDSLELLFASWYLLIEYGLEKPIFTKDYLKKIQTREFELNITKSHLPFGYFILGWITNVDNFYMDLDKHKETDFLYKAHDMMPDNLLYKWAISIGGKRDFLEKKIRLNLNIDSKIFDPLLPTIVIIYFKQDIFQK